MKVGERIAFYDRYTGQRLEGVVLSEKGLVRVEPSGQLRTIFEDEVVKDE